MARVLNSFNKGLETGYGFADKADKKKTAYERYIEEHYGPGVTSHRDPIALARAAAGQVGSAVWGGVKTGAGALGHAAAGLMGAPQGPSGAVSDGRGGIGSDRGAVSGITPSNRLYDSSAVSAGLSSAGSSGSGYGSFNDIGSRISSDLQRDFGLTSNQAAGVVGNLGHESGGFRHYQELNPTSGRGGAGWAQWTGPRRVAFESYVKNNNLHPQSYEANYGFLKNELTGTHAGALAAVKKANTVQDAVYAFEQTFEKANPKYVNYGSRMQYASRLDPSSSSSQVAQLQRDLNAKGANLEVDGIMGPLTRAEQQKYSGTTYASTTQDEGRVPTAGVAGQRAPVQVASAEVPGLGTPNLGATRGVSIGPGPARVAPNVPQTPYYSNPYTSSTGGAITADRPVGTAYNAYEAQRNAARLGPTVAPRQVQTQAVDATGYPPVQMQGAFNRPAVPQTPAFMNPYSGTTGGANAIQAPMQTARIPQPRPPQAPQARPDQAVPTTPAANWTLADIQQWADKHGIPVSKAAGVLSDIGSRVGNAVSSGGMGQSFSGAQNSGLGYVGGRGYGGGSINRGTGGAINPNR